MAVVFKEFYFDSVADGGKIRAASWKPKKGDIIGVFQIIHGMAEHIMRYDEFARFLAESGYAVYANDHIGHGKSTNLKYPLGYFGDKNEAGATFAADVKALTEIAKKENPGLPVILFGHSMGSFVARRYSAKYGKGIDGVIYCGTAGPNPAAPVAIKIAEVLCKFFGAKKPGFILDKLAFGTYNSKTEKRTNFDWLTKDDAIVDEYIADDLCGFLFSNRGYFDLLTLLNYVSSKAWLGEVPTDLPILMVAGDRDPVGPYGKGVEKVANSLRSTDHKVDLILYPGDRHEILNEVDRDAVYEDILNWADGVIEASGKTAAKGKKGLLSKIFDFIGIEIEIGFGDDDDDDEDEDED